MILGSNVLPALLAGLVCAIVFQVWRKKMKGADDARWKHAAVGGSIALGLIVSICFVQESMVLFPPTLKMSIEWWVAYFALLCVGGAVLGAVKPWKTMPRLLGRFVLCALGAGAVVTPIMLSAYYSVPVGLAWIGGLSVWLFVSASLAERAAKHKPACTGAALVHIYSGVAAPVVLLWNNQTFSKILGAIAGATLALGILSLWRKRAAMLKGTTSLATILTGALAAGGYIWGYPAGPRGGPIVGLILAAMFLSPIAGEIPFISKRPWLRLSAQLLVATIIGGVALGFAIYYGDINELLKLIGLEAEDPYGY